MRRINGIGGAVIGGIRPKPAAAPGGGFAVEAESAQGAARAEAAQRAGLAGMLALQEAEAGIVGNRNGRRHGLTVLDALQDLQRGLLGGTDGSEGSMACLARLAETRPPVTDSGLEAVLSAIRLRAKIELLRRGVETG